MTVIEFKLPGKEDLSIVLDGVLESAGIKTLNTQIREAALDAASGLTTIEAENAFALSVVETTGIDSAVIAREKAQAVKKSGILELAHRHRRFGDGADRVAIAILQASAVNRFLSGRFICHGDLRVVGTIALPETAHSALALVKYLRVACAPMLTKCARLFRTVAGDFGVIHEIKLAQRS
jgi:hypothetical protein